MIAWQEVTLAEISEKPQYGAIASAVDEPVGPLFVRQTDIITGRVDWSGVPFAALSSTDNEKYRLRAGDLLISRLGAGVGNAARMDDTAGAVFAGYLVRFRVRPQLADDRFVGYALQSNRWREHVRAVRSGGAQPTLNAKQMGTFRFALPPLEEQERIAGVLGAFDDLIETIRRLADQLDEARGSRVSAALAESTFETRLSDIAAFVNGRNFTKGADGVGRPVIRTPEVRSGPGGNTVWNSVEADDDRIASAGDILFVWSGTLMVNRWLYTDGLVNQHVFKVTPHGVPGWYVYALIEAQLTWFLGLAKDKATTMGHIQRAHLDEPVIGLNDAAIQRLGAVVEPIWSGALELRREALDLARQRDELLPLLMSGRVRVRDMEGAIS